MLIEAGANINANNLIYNDRTLLMDAVSSSSMDMIETLVANGADVTMVNDEGQNAGMMAISTRAIWLKEKTSEDEILEIIKLFVSKGLDIHASSQYGDTLL